MIPGGIKMKIKFLILLLGLAFTASSIYAESRPGPPALIRDKGCGGCHRFADTPGREPQKGPDLFYAGNKFRETWLGEFLRKPETIRKAGYIADPGYLLGKPEIAQPHPALSEAEAKIATDYLLTLKMPDMETGVVDTEPLSKAAQARAKFVFERNHGCVSCHESIDLAGKARGGISGPSLVSAGNRLNADWVWHWLNDPRKFEPKGRMPVFKLEKADAILIVKYLVTLKKENLRQE